MRFVNEKFCISITILRRFVSKGLFVNNPKFVCIMSWHRIGDSLLSEPMLTRLTDAYMRQEGEMRFSKLCTEDMIYQLNNRLIATRDWFHVVNFDG